MHGVAAVSTMGVAAAGADEDVGVVVVTLSAVASASEFCLAWCRRVQNLYRKTRVGPLTCAKG